MQFGNKTSANRRSGLLKATAVIAGGIALIGSFSLLLGMSDAVSASPENAIRKTLPKTQIDEIDCDRVNGLCEVVAGENIFYADDTGQFLFIGRIFDTKRLVDVTAERLLELNPDKLVQLSAAKVAEPPSFDAINAATGEGGRSHPRRIPLITLPQTGYVDWGPGSEIDVTLLADPRCGYCARLRADLAALNLRVREYIVPLLGNPAPLAGILCADKPRNALQAAYDRKPASAQADCDVSTLLANRTFFVGAGLTGTPVMVRSDGAVLQGALGRDRTKAWLAQTEETSR